MENNTLLEKLSQKKEALNAIGENHVKTKKAESIKNKIMGDWLSYKSEVKRKNNKILARNLIILVLIAFPICLTPVFDAFKSILMGNTDMPAWPAWLFILGIFLFCMSDRTFMFNFNEFYSNKLSEEEEKCLSALVLEKSELNSLYDLLNESYGEQLLSMKIVELRRNNEEIGSYDLLQRLYSNAIKYETLKLEAQNGTDQQKQIKAILNKED